MARSGLSIFIALLSILSATIYTRKDALLLFYINRPERMPQINELPNSDIKFQTLVRNCEDAYMNHAQGWALLSCDPGRDKWNTVMGTFISPLPPPQTGIYFYPYSSSSPSPAPILLPLHNFPSPPEDFHPLGIEYLPSTRTLFVVNHAFSGSRLELFTLDLANLSSPSLRHALTIQHPLLHTPNSVAVFSEEEVFVTNDHYFPRRKYGVLAAGETYLSFPKGNVAVVRLGWKAGEAVPEVEGVRVLEKVGFANGVAVLDGDGDRDGDGDGGKRLAVASTNGAKVKIFEVETEARGEGKEGVKGLRLREEVKVRFAPDNLSVDDRGVLLIAGHPYPPGITRVAASRGRCEEGERGEECRSKKAPSWIAEWSSASGKRDLYAGDGFGSAVTALRDVERGFGMAVGLYERGILTWEVR